MTNRRLPAETPQQTTSADGTWSAAVLDAARALPPQALAVRADDRQAPELGGWRLTPVPYLVLCLAGRVAWQRPDGSLITLQPGMGLIAQAGTYANIHHIAPARFLRITFAADETVIGENHLRGSRRRGLRSTLTLHLVPGARSICADELLQRILQWPEERARVAALSTLLAELRHSLPAAASTLSQAERRYREAILAVRERLEEAPSRDHIAASVGCSPAYLSRLCQRFGGRSFQEHLLALRIERAQQLLRLQGTRPIAAIARQCGFSSGNYFAQVFRARIGCSPRQWRDRQALPSAQSAGESMDESG